MKTILYIKLEEKFINDWVSLWENSLHANYVNSPHWFLAILHTFNYQNYKIIALYRNNKLAVVSAFIKEKKYGVDFYSMLPGDFVYGIPILGDLQDTELFTTLVAELVKVGNIFMENIPQDIAFNLKKYIPTMHTTPSSLNYYFNFEKNNENKIIIKNR